MGSPTNSGRPWRILLRAAAALAMALPLCGPVYGQAVWSRLIGDAPDEDLWAVRELADGTVLSAGALNDTPSLNATWLVRMDSDGTILSEKWYTNPEIAFPTPSDSVALSSDGGAFLTGRDIRQFFEEHNAWILRVEPNGDIGWSRTIYTEPLGGAQARWMLTTGIATFDGGFVGAGVFTVTDASPVAAWVIKLDAAGAVEWQHLYFDGPLDIQSITQLEDEGFALAGMSALGGGLGDAWVLRLRADGRVVWSLALGGADQDSATDVIETTGGDLAVAGWSNSFTSSRHAPFAARLDSQGNLLWSQVFGDTEWGDFQGVQTAIDGGLLFTGRISGPPTFRNDLWTVKTDADGTILSQQAFTGSPGGYGNLVEPALDGSLYVGGTWGWGITSEESFWLLKVDAQGRVPGCELMTETVVSSRSPRMSMATDLPTMEVPQNVNVPGDFTTGDTATRTTLHCEAIACTPLSCDEILPTQEPYCALEDIGFTLQTTGGEGDVSVHWDFDDDGTIEVTENPTNWSFAEGAWTVVATAEDSCDPVQSCELSLPVEVLSDVPPLEVSQVSSGAPPLLVRKFPDRVVVENVPEATAYNLYADRLGSWYFPGGASGNICPIQTWTDNLDGTLTLDVPLPGSSWFVVTASTRCAEGPAGGDSEGRERTGLGNWERCGGSGFSD